MTLHIRNLTAGYGEKKVVERITLTLPKGEHCVILGASGSGKTTLLYAIAGLLTPSSGTVTLDEQPIQRTQIGIIYQTLHMVSALSVQQNILLAPYAAGLPQEVIEVETLLTKLGLYEHRHKKPYELSQGQQQRVAIARAVITKPALILGDELTAALDDKNCDIVMTLLLDMVILSGATLIIATHDARIRHYFTNILMLGDTT